MFKKGQRVRIKKGARCSSTHPRHVGVIESKRATVVVLHSVDERTELYGEVRPAMVHWAGSGGYWKWCPAEDAEPIE